MNSTTTRHDIECLVDLDHRRYVVATEPMVFHCHHYNTALQRSLEDAPFIDTKDFMVGAAAEVAWNQLRTYFATHGVEEVEARKYLTCELFRWAGFGTLDLSSVDSYGGTVQTESSHYAVAWLEKFGETGAPVCHFMAGFLAGAMAAIYEEDLGAYSSDEVTCKACGYAFDEFTVEKGTPNYKIFKPAGVGALEEHRPIEPPATTVDYDGILKAVQGLDLVGDARGMIPAFGVYLTRMYANYYNRISFEFMHALEAVGPEAGLHLAKELLVEAGHVCAFNTFGGVMTSPEWDALVKPTLRDRNDWVHGIVAVVNGLGWGRWQVASLNENDAEFVIHDDYESSGYLTMYGMASRNVSFLAEGAAAGIMNLTHVGHIESRPALTDDFYHSLFKTADSFQTEVLACKAMGDGVTRIRVTR